MSAMKTHDSTPAFRPPVLDWNAYYQSFEEAHGGNPVPWQGRLLFSDGWQHSATDCRGPEIKPPDDGEHLSRLKVAYWSIRRWIVRGELLPLRSLNDELKQLVKSRSLPLQAKVRRDGRWTTRTLTEEDVGDARLAWLEHDLELCDQRLAELREATVAVT